MAASHGSVSERVSTAPFNGTCSTSFPVARANIVFFSSGYFSQKQIISYGLVLSAVSSALVLVLGYPYWSMIGLM